MIGMRTIKHFVVERRFSKIDPKALSGIYTSAGAGGKWRTIDFDNWLKGKKREGFKVKETPKGVLLSRGNGIKEKIFVGAKDITVIKKMNKVI
jgi:hypothetical protein